MNQFRRVALYDSNAQPLWLFCDHCAARTPHDLDALVANVDGPRTETVGALELTCNECESGSLWNETDRSREVVTTS